jgi:hypothetical protein
MSKFAKVVNDTVVEVLDALEGRIHPALHGDYVQVPDTVEPGMVKNGRKFEAPEPVAPVEAEAQPVALDTRVSRVEFLRRFKRAERIALRGAETKDPVIGDFMLMLNLADEVDLSGEDVVEGLAYLEAQNLLPKGRREEILAG